MHKKNTLFLTGGSGGIGGAIAKKFASCGFEVLAPDRRDLDLSNMNSVEDYFSGNVPEIDVLIHSAGINMPKTLADLKPQDLERIMQINANSFFRLIQKFAPAMKTRKNGKILAISSLWSIMSRPGRLPYSMSKHALSGLVQTAALELAPFNILVNALSPGFVDTAMTRENNTQAAIETIMSRVPLGRLARPEEIAETAYFLCSEENTYITGQNIIIDGGVTAGFVE